MLYKPTFLLIMVLWIVWITVLFFQQGWLFQDSAANNFLPETDFHNILIKVTLQYFIFTQVTV
jgi:hypothetical protein